ncbi:MAG: DUF4258 domain-containing protein [Anaerolineae bacterium]
MSTLIKQTFIRQKAIERKVKWTSHALSKLAPEPESVGDVEIALQQAEVIEEYPHVHRYLPDCLVLAFLSSGKPIHCVIAINELRDYILIVTIYKPTEQEWKDDWRTRK